MLLCAAQIHAQTPGSSVSKYVLIRSDTLQLDSFPIAPGSFRIDSMYMGNCRIDHASGILIWSGPNPPDSIVVSYRRLMVDLNRTYRHKDPQILERFFTENPFSYVPPRERYNTLGNDQISTNGNISRGIGFGNNQDLVVNSNLNLRMSGKIADDINVLAAISDENNPIQPEGNTQQIQDFDRVYITLWKDSSGLTAGDFPMNSDPNGYFMNYRKRSRGLQFGHAQTTSVGHLKLSGEGAVSRGRFTRNLIEGIEGNQGPYRLRGSNGELFIIVIAGTEKVFLDGKLLERGQENDYTIDYNSGEITFMPAQLITRYSRIVVEFQYSDRNYARSVVRGGAELQRGKWLFYGNYFTEQDHKNRPFQQDLELYDSLNGISAREVLARAGNDEQPAISSARLQENFDPSRILYIKRDSAGFGDIYQYAPVQGEFTRFYQITFSYVGEGAGDYVPLDANANGKVFRWVAPIGGSKQGSYEPVQILIAPERMQMLSLGGIYRIDSNARLQLEWSGSNLDQNTFNPDPNTARTGQGFMLNYLNTPVRNIDSARKSTFSTNIRYEFAGRDLRYVERYRDVEFDRKWNRTLQNQGDVIEKLGDEHYLSAKLAWKHSKGLYLDLDESFFRRSRELDGWQQVVEAGLRRKRNELSVVSENLRASTPFGTSILQNRFDRAAFTTRQKLGGTIAGIQVQTERSVFNPLNSDSLNSASYRFEQYRAFLQNADSGSLRYGVQLSRRDDHVVRNGAFQTATIGQDATLQAGWDAGNDLGLNLTGTYRQLNLSDSLQNEETVQGRLELRWNALKRLIRTQAYYQLGTGQEQRREFSYLQVGDGNGLYIWNDFDSNGVQTLNEFVIASDYDRQRANFIRQYVPVAGLVKSYSSEFNSTVRIQSMNRNKANSSFLGFMRRFSILSSTRIQKKVSENSVSAFLNPFYLALDDSTLISTATTFRNTLSYNRASPVFGIDVQHLLNDAKSLLVNGFDSRDAEELNVRFRYNLQRRWELVQEFTRGTRGHRSQFLGTGSYTYDFDKWSPELQFYFSRDLRLSSRYIYFEAHNRPEFGGGSTYNHELRNGLRLNALNKGSLSSEFGFVQVNFIGNESSALGYALLEGLRDGRNFTWNFQAERRFKNNVQALITYDGRKSVANNAIHMGRVQVRYLF